jgi:hypothetical protein
MRASGTYSVMDLRATEEQVSRALLDAGLPADIARGWLSSASGRLRDDAQWALDYDVDLQVASFEVWRDGRMLFGLDDWLPPS